jgi:uncharacterized membrane protein YdbT with pleckstrin-like domain
MGYAQKHLHDGESIKHLNTLHWIIFGWPLFWLVLAVLLKGNAFAVLVFLAASASALSRWIDLKTSEFAVTDSRIILKTGLIRRRSIEMNLVQVEGVTIDQGMIGRMLNFGTVAVRGTGGSTDTFALISYPMEFKRAVQEQSQNVRVNEIGKHVAALQGQAAPPLAAEAIPFQPSVVDSLERLGKLKADGVLTEEEFQAQKGKLLA